MEHILPFSQEHGLLPRGGLILCALSGGMDSVALLHFLKSHGFSVAAAHFDHHLRPSSGEDARFCRELCQGWDVPFYLGGGWPGERGGNTEENARNARYAFLEEIAARTGAVRVATAHHANDNLETILFHLARGCGLQGVSGIQPRRGMLVRPMLHTTRSAIEGYVEAWGLSYVTDESNADVRYARNLLRHQVVPVLETLNPRAVEASLRMADRLRDALERLGPWTPPEEEVRLPPLVPQEVAVGRRVDTPLWSLETAWAVCPGLPPTPLEFYLRPVEGMTLRARQVGDYLHPPFRTGKSLKKWMIELGVPRGEREAVPVLTAGEKLLAVAGIGPQESCLAQPGERAIFVKWTKPEKKGESVS